MSESDAIIVPLISDETRRIAANLAMHMYANEPCRICGLPLLEADIWPQPQFADYGPNGEARFAHRYCWISFVELLQTLPTERLYRLTAGLETING